MQFFDQKKRLRKRRSTKTKPIWPKNHTYEGLLRIPLKTAIFGPKIFLPKDGHIFGFSKVLKMCQSLGDDCIFFTWVYRQNP